MIRKPQTPWSTLSLAFALVAMSLVDCMRLSAADPAGAEKPVLVESRLIWNRAAHNAFTDLLRFKDRWYCVFREGTAHVSPDGALRVISRRLPRK